MKLCTFIKNDAPRVGVSTSNGIVDVTALGFPASMNEIIVGGAPLREKISAALAGYSGEYLDAATLTFGNITEPQKLVCEGLNYVDHAEETGGEAPKYPVFFAKFNDSLAPAGSTVELPSWQRCFDYEAELVIVVGRPAYNIPPEDAGDYIFGYACGNDLSARDSQFLSSQWMSGKSFPNFGPAGPFIVTHDELDPEQGLEIYCEVNGNRVQNGNTSNMIYTCRQTLAWASKYFALAPGDLIFTGTPAGVILGKPKGERTWLVPGDVVTVGIEGIGELVTPLA